jgi:hypothetical protein
MRTEIIVFALASALAFSLGLAAGAASAEPATEARATLPLDQLLRLERELEEKKRAPREAPPPVAAALEAVEVTGRLVEQSLELTAHFEVSVLQDGWLSVPLLRMAPGLQVAARPELSDATLALADGWLVLVTKKAGKHRFDVSLLARSPSAAGVHRIELEPARATLASLQVAHDERLYRLEGALTRSADGVRVALEEGRFRLAWQPLAAATERARADVARPELEPVVPSAAASLVSTLDGHWLTRVQYRLRFTGSREIEVRIPAGVRVSKVFQDRVALPVATDGDRLRLQLSPARSGGEEALLELVLEQDHGPYHLAGRLDLELPELSWPIHELSVALHLPPVFAYRWLDGSLSPVERVPESTFTYDVPEPGKRLTFHQLLVTRSAPHLSLAYDVDLTNAYFVP